MQMLRQAVASAAGGAERLVCQYVAAGVETGCGQCCRWSRIGETKVLTCTLLYFPFFVLFFPLSFLFCFFLHLLGGERRGKEWWCTWLHFTWGGGGGQR